MDDIQEAVVASFWRCEYARGFFDTFYDLFSAKSPEISQKFANTDMKKQKQVVMASLLKMLRLRTGDEQARRPVEEIGESCSRAGQDIRPELYEFWLDALCESVKKHDPEYTPKLESIWREAMRPGMN